MVEATGTATSLVRSIDMTHDGGTKDSGMTARAWPSSVTLTRLTGSGTGRAAAAPRMSVVTAKALSKLFLTELFRLMQADYKLLVPDSHAVHRVHSGRSCTRLSGGEATRRQLC